MSKVIKSLLILITVFLVGMLLYNKYDERAFLRYGVLKIDKYPDSMTMLDYETGGSSDFHAEYNITIDSKDFKKLLVGRKYIKEDANNTTNLDISYEEPCGFTPAYRYHSGTLRSGIIVIFINAGSTKAFINYWVN